MAARSGKEPPNAVQLNQLMCERVRKELRCQKLHTEYGVNPLQRVHAIAKKPMSWHDNIEEPADDSDGPY
ncbi:Fam183a isoform B [Columba livia]|nr:Fam183a isoform B [Columba livia]